MHFHFKVFKGARPKQGEHVYFEIGSFKGRETASVVYRIGGNK